MAAVGFIDDTNNLKPWMKSAEITEEVIKAMKTKEYQFIRVNYPNGDALGHTGIYRKVIEGIEELDKCLGRLKENIIRDDIVWIITADHGNCENMIDSDETPNKMHSTNPVPFIIVDKSYNIDPEYVGKLSDIAPTILKIMDLEIPKEMTGKVLID